MYWLTVLLVIIGVSSFVSADHTPTSPVAYDGPSQDVVTAFKPSLGVVIGILSIMFSLTFIILVYAKFCHSAATVRHFHRDAAFGGLTRTSGLRSTLAARSAARKSAPPIRKSSLTRTAYDFYRVRAILVEREENDSNSGRLSSRFGIRSSFRKHENGDKETLIKLEIDHNEGMRKLHRFNHKIVLSDVVFKNRWSSRVVRRVAVDSNNLRSGGGDDIVEVEEAGFSGNGMRLMRQSDQKRSMSEITQMPRLQIDKSGTNEEAEEKRRRRRIWFPIARRTVQWFANRENRRDHNWTDKKNTRQNVNV
ncbi:hypothetical protein QQ045_000834 [Rhodiola kirilowii]